MKTKLPSSIIIRHSSLAALLAAVALCFTAPVALSQGGWGSALLFDGVDDYVQAPAIPLADASFTIEAWARRDTTGTMDMIVSQGNGAPGTALMFGFHWFGFDFDFYGDGVSSTNIDNAWHHWAGTYNASSKVRCLYRDGVLLASNVAAQNYQGSGPLSIGREPFDDPAYFAGAIDNVCIWNVARNQAEIQADMSQPLAGTEAGLLAYYRFDEGAGLTAYDSFTNHFEATLVNGPVWTVSGVGILSMTQSNVFFPNVLTYSFFNARPPSGPGTLKVTTVADLDMSSEFLTLAAEGVLTSNLFVTGGQQMVEVSTVVNLTQSQLAALAADGTITFTLTPSSDVNDLSPSWARLELNYPSASPVGFVNGSFETGDFTGWFTTDLTDPFSPLAVGTAGYTPWSGFFTSLPTDGTFAATFGFDGNGPGTIQIAQDVVVPASATLLTFDYRAAWDLVNFSQNPLPRMFRVVVQPAGGGAELAAFTNLVAPTGTITNDTGPITGTNDLTAFAGSNVRVSFQAYIPETYTGPGFFQLDHVRFLPDPHAVDHFTWATVGSPQVAGAPFPVTITARNQSNDDATNFSGTVALSGAVGATATNSILGSQIPQLSANAGPWTLGYSFTPNTDLTVTHVRHYFGSKVSIWTDTGVLLASQNVTSVPGTWVETPLASPIQLTNGVRYRVAAYSAGANYDWRYDLAGTFPYGTIDVGYEGSGDAFPMGSDTIRWWFVDLRYTAAVTVSVAVAPAYSLNFVNGVWSGDLTVLHPATNMSLLAADNADRARHRGTSGPFDVLSQAEALDHFVWSTIASPQVAGTPIPVTITAWDKFNNPATWFSGPVALSASVKFAARFDSGLDSFSFVADPVAPSTNLWHRTSHRYASPTNCLYYGREGVWNYDTGARNAGNAQSPVISLAGSTAPITLSFKYLLLTEPDTSFDRATVLISADGGTSWTTLAGPLPNSASFAAWTADISAYAGSNIVLRFNFDTLDSIFNAYEGWYLDDVVVTASTAVAINPANSGNFVNGVWSGNLTVLQPAANLVVVAADNAGHLGTCNPFDVRPPPAVFSSGSVVAPGLFHLCGTGLPSVTYTLQTSTNLVDWVDYAKVVAGTNGLIDCVEDMDNNAPTCFYRLKWP